MSARAGTLTAPRVAPLAIAGAIVGVEVLILWRFGWSVALMPYGFFGVVAVMLAARDLATLTLPNVIVLPSFPIALALLAFASGVGHDWGSFVRAAIAMVVISASLLALALVMAGHLGLADVKLGALAGLYAGWLSWPTVLLAVLAGFVIAACWALPMAVRKRELRYRFAFGPFLLAGAMLAILTR